MYALAHVKVAQLKEFTIDHQDTIIAKTGEALDLEKAYLFLKEQTDDFTKAHPEAQQADQLLAALLPTSFFKKELKPAAQQTNNLSLRLRLQEQERLRVLQLLALEHAA